MYKPTAITLLPNYRSCNGDSLNLSQNITTVARTCLGSKKHLKLDEGCAGQHRRNTRTFGEDKFKIADQDPADDRTVKIRRVLVQASTPASLVLGGVHATPWPPVCINIPRTL